MITRRVQSFLLLLAPLAVMLFAPVPVSAGVSISMAIKTADTAKDMIDNPMHFVPPLSAMPNGTLKTTGGIPCMLIPEAAGGALIGKMVPCLIRTIEISTVNFSQKMVDMLRPLLYTFLTLVLTLFGVRMATGEPEIWKQGFMLLVKVALVITVLNNIPTYFVPKTYEIMKESQEIIIGAIDTSKIQCSTGPAFTLGKTPKVWVLMDCITGKLFGYTTGTIGGGANMLLVTSFFGLLSGFLFGGTWGVVVFFGMLGVLVTMFTLVVRVIMSFITGYLTVCLMLIISPLILPLIFLKTTAQYFEGLWKNILGGFLLPIIVSAYAMLALMLYDRMLFADNSIVQELFKYTKVASGLEDAKQPCNWNVSGKPEEMRVTPGLSPTAAKEEAKKMIGATLMQGLNPTSTGTNDLCGSIRTPVFNIDRINDSEFGKGKETYNKIFENLATLFILAYLIKQGLTGLTTMVGRLVGASVTTRSMDALAEGEKKIGAASQAAQNQAIQSMQGKSGGDFLKAAPEVLGESTKAFFGGVVRK